MIGGIADDCEVMVDGAAGLLNAWKVDWLGRVLRLHLQAKAQLVRPADSPQVQQSRVGQQERCRRGIGHASSVSCCAVAVATAYDGHFMSTCNVEG